MRDVPDYASRPTIQLAFPEGGDVFFIQSENDSSLYLPPASQPYRIKKAGNMYTLQKADGTLYHFEKKTRVHYPVGQEFYRLHSFQDVYDNTYAVGYSAWEDDDMPKRISEPAGRFIDLIYQKLDRLAQFDSHLGDIPHEQEAGTWVEVPVYNGQSFRWLTLKYTNGYEEEAPLAISEIEFYDENNQKISGSPFGSDPAAAAGNKFDKAFDGDTSTYFRYKYKRNGYAGIDLGEGVYKKVSKIRYFLPDLNDGSVVAPAKFVGLIGTDTLQGYGDHVIKEVKTSDGRSVVYNYETFTDPSGLFSWVTLGSVDYPDGTQASYNYNQVHPYTRPILDHAIDPKVEGNGTMIAYTFDQNDSIGFIEHEHSGATDEVIASTNWIDRNKPQVIYPNGRTISFEYGEQNAQLLKRTDGRGYEKSFTYDQGGNGYIETSTDEEGFVTSFINDSYGNVLSETRPNGSVISYVRDLRGRVLSKAISSTGETDRVYSYTRDSNGRITRKDYPNGSFEEWTYNNFGQALTHRLRSGGTESWTYYPNGLVQNYTDAAGIVNGYSYDNRDRQTHHWNGLGQLTLTAFNDFGNPTTITHPDGNQSSFAYDDFGNLISTTNELGNTWTTVYNEFRQKLSETDPLNRTTQYAYSLTAAGSSGCGACNTKNLPRVMMLPSGRTISYEYDLEWNLIEQSDGVGSSDKATTQYQYDGKGQRTAVIDPEGNSTAIAYDEMGEVISITDPLGRVTAYNYDGFGQRIQITRANGTSKSRSFNSMGSLLSATNELGETTLYEYDLAGNKTKMIDAKSSVYRWEYDTLNRNTKAYFPDNSFTEAVYNQVSDVAHARTRAGVWRNIQSASTGLILHPMPTIVMTQQGD